MRAHTAIVLGALTLAMATAPARAIERGQTQDFSAGIGGWERGEIQTPGPGGASDPFLLVGAGAGNRLVTSDQTIWAGDYRAAHVTGIALQVRNFGPTDLVVRLAIGDTAEPMLGGSWYATDGVPLPAASGWQSASFSLDPAALVMVQGGASAEAVLADVATLRILQASEAGAMGDFATGSFGVDAIVAVPEPGAAGRLAAAAALALGARRRPRWRGARAARSLGRPRAGGES